MNTKIVVMCLVLTELYKYVGCAPQKRQRGIVFKNRTNSPVIPIILTRRLSTTSPPPFLARKYDTISSAKTTNKETPNEIQVKELKSGLDCASDTKTLHKNIVTEVEEPKDSPDVPLFQTVVGFENDVVPDVTNKPTSGNDLTSANTDTEVRNAYPLTETEDSNTLLPIKSTEFNIPPVEDTEEKNETMSTLLQKLYSDLDLEKAPLKTSDQIVGSMLSPNKPTMYTHVDVSTSNGNEMDNNSSKSEETTSANSFYIPESNELIEPVSDPDNGDDEVIKKEDVVKEIIDRHPETYASSNPGERYTCKYVQLQEDGTWRSVDVPTYTMYDNQQRDRSFQPYDINSYSQGYFSGPQNINVLNSPYYTPYANRAPSYASYYGNLPSSQVSHKNEIKYDNVDSNLANNGARSLTSIIVPFGFTDSGNYEIGTSGYQPDTYTLKEALNDLYLDEPSNESNNIQNNLNVAMGSPGYSNYLYNWNNQPYSSYQPRIFQKYDPVNKCLFTEVVMPMKNSERVWRSWRKTEIHTKKKNRTNFTPIGSPALTISGKDKVTNTLNNSSSKNRRVGAIDSYFVDGGSSKPWRTRLDYSPTSS